MKLSLNCKHVTPSLWLRSVTRRCPVSRLHTCQSNAVNYTFYHYSPQTKFAKVMFLHVSVILSTGGVCLSACWDTTPPSRQPLPPSRGAGITPEQAPPRSRQTPPKQCMLGDTTNKRAVCILLECILVVFVFKLIGFISTVI